MKAFDEFLEAQDNDEVDRLATLLVDRASRLAQRIRRGFSYAGDMEMAFNQFQEHVQEILEELRWQREDR